MLAASYLQPVAREIVMGDEKELHKNLFLKNLSAIDVNEFAGKKIVIKGCGETPIADYVYMEINKTVAARAQSIMYGEPCSTVPFLRKLSKKIAHSLLAIPYSPLKPAPPFKHQQHPYRNSKHGDDGAKKTIRAVQPGNGFEVHSKNAADDRRRRKQAGNDRHHLSSPRSFLN
jgi:hypothetical protein